LATPEKIVIRMRNTKFTPPVVEGGEGTLIKNGSVFKKKQSRGVSLSDLFIDIQEKRIK